MPSKVIGWRVSLALLALGFIFSAGQQAAAQTVGPGDVLFSEFRLSGPGLAGDGSDSFADEYMEFYCNRDTDCDISGYAIIAYDPAFATSPPTSGGRRHPGPPRLLVGAPSATASTLSRARLLRVVGRRPLDFVVDNEGFQSATPTSRW